MYGTVTYVSVYAKVADMNRLDRLKTELRERIVSTPELADIAPTPQVERSSDGQFGDLTTNVALQYAKSLKTSPLALAEAIAAHLRQAHISEIKDITIAKPGFINFRFSEEFLIDNLRDILEAGSSFGSNTALAGERWVIEHTSPNPNKAMHLGHLRNNLVGMSVYRILQWSGATVVTDEIDNNRGIAIAKVMYGFLAHMKKDKSLPTEVSAWVEHKDKWYTPEEKGMGPDVFVTQCYVLAEKSIQEDEAAEAYTRQLVVDWEAGDQAVWALWEHVLQYAYAGIEKTLTRLGSHFDKVWHEHEHYQAGKQYVAAGLEKGVFQKLEDGAVLTNLGPDYGLPDTILLKRDGTALYITQDIALTALKKNTYNADKLVWVVGPDQSLAMQQLFAVCEQLGIGKREDFTHVSYGYVGLKADDGGFQKMSSRADTVVLIDDLIDAVKAKIETSQSGLERESETAPDLSEKLALAAVKFAILKSDRHQDLIFDINQSISVTGDSGIYVVYSYVRTVSVLKKFEKTILPEQINRKKIETEKELLCSLVFFPSVIERAKSDLSAHHIAIYLLEICSLFNTWYATEQILDNSDREAHKLAVTKATGQVIINGLSILGIETVDKM